MGFDWADPEAIVEKIEEELMELKLALSDGDHDLIEDEVGDLLFSNRNCEYHTNYLNIYS